LNGPSPRRACAGKKGVPAFLEVIGNKSDNAFSGAIPERDRLRLLFCGRKVRGAMARNGGTMAEPKQAQREDEARGKASGTTTNRKREGARREKAARMDGVERLRMAADRALGRNVKKLSDRLAQRAVDGNLASLRVLVMLAEGKKPRPEPVKKPRGPSRAQRLASEPEWEEGKEGTGTRE